MGQHGSRHRKPSTASEKITSQASKVNTGRKSKSYPSGLKSSDSSRKSIDRDIRKKSTDVKDNARMAVITEKTRDSNPVKSAKTTAKANTLKKQTSSEQQVLIDEHLAKEDMKQKLISYSRAEMVENLNRIDTQKEPLTTPKLVETIKKLEKVTQSVANVGEKAATNDEETEDDEADVNSESKASLTESQAVIKPIVKQILMAKVNDSNESSDISLLPTRDWIDPKTPLRDDIFSPVPDDSFKADAEMAPAIVDSFANLKEACAARKEASADVKATKEPITETIDVVEKVRLENEDTYVLLEKVAEVKVKDDHTDLVHDSISDEQIPRQRSVVEDGMASDSVVSGYVRDVVDTVANEVNDDGDLRRDGSQYRKQVECLSEHLSGDQLQQKDDDHMTKQQDKNHIEVIQQQEEDPIEVITMTSDSSGHNLLYERTVSGATLEQQLLDDASDGEPLPTAKGVVASVQEGQAISGTVRAFTSHHNRTESSSWDRLQCLVPALAQCAHNDAAGHVTYIRADSSFVSSVYSVMQDYTDNSGSLQAFSDIARCALESIEKCNDVVARDVTSCMLKTPCTSLDASQQTHLYEELLLTSLQRNCDPSVVQNVAKLWLLTPPPSCDVFELFARYKTVIKRVQRSWPTEHFDLIALYVCIRHGLLEFNHHTVPLMKQVVQQFDQRVKFQAFQEQYLQTKPLQKMAPRFIFDAMLRREHAPDCFLDWSERCQRISGKVGLTPSSPAAMTSRASDAGELALWSLQLYMNEMTESEAARDEAQAIAASVDVFMRTLVRELCSKVFDGNAQSDDALIKLVGCSDGDAHCFQPDRFCYIVIFESLDFLESPPSLPQPEADNADASPGKPLDEHLPYGSRMSDIVLEQDGSKMLTASRLKQCVHRIIDELLGDSVVSLWSELHRPKHYKELKANSFNILAGCDARLSIEPIGYCSCTSSNLTVKLTWRGSVFLNMPVHVEIVAGMHTEPVDVSPRYHPLLQHRTDQLPLVAADHAVLFRVCYLELENDVLKHLPDVIKKGYMLSKAVRSILPSLMAAADAAAGVAKPDLNSYTQLVTTCQLRTAVLHLMHSSYDVGNTERRSEIYFWAIRIYEKLRELVSTYGRVSSYFTMSMKPKTSVDSSLLISVIDQIIAFLEPLKASTMFDEEFGLTTHDAAAGLGPGTAGSHDLRDMVQQKRTSAFQVEKVEKVGHVMRLLAVGDELWCCTHHGAVIYGLDLKRHCEVTLGGFGTAAVTGIAPINVSDVIISSSTGLFTSTFTDLLQHDSAPCADVSVYRDFAYVLLSDSATCAASVSNTINTDLPPAVPVSGAVIHVRDMQAWALRHVIRTPCRCRLLTPSHSVKATADMILFCCGTANKLYVCSNACADDLTRTRLPDSVATPPCEKHEWMPYRRLAMPHPGIVCQIDADLSLLVMEAIKKACKLRVMTADGCRHDIDVGGDVSAVVTARCVNNKLYVVCQQPSKDKDKAASRVLMMLS